MLDLERLLAPVTPEAPCGAALDYQPDFTALFELARGRPEQRMGESVISAVPPDWGQVERQALALLARSKDLRVATLLTKALLHQAGLPGLHEGLALTRVLLERRWEAVHPQLDPGDGDDPAARASALADLADPETVLSRVRDAEVATARGVGRVQVRDLERSPRASAAPGGPDGEERPRELEPVLAACDPAALAGTFAAAEAALADVQAIEAVFRERTGAPGPSLAALSALLQRVARALEGHVPRAQAAGAAAAPAPGAAEPAAAATGGEIRSREDVVRALDGICAFYERHEPSSPVPLLLRRSQRLVSLGFVDIVRDLLPEAVGSVETLRGRSG